MAEKNSKIPLWLVLMPGVLLPFALLSFANRIGLVEKGVVVALLVVSGIILNRWLVLSGGMGRLHGFIEKNANKIFAALIFLHFAVFLTLALIKYYSFAYVGQDTAFFEQSFWNTGLGKFFYRSQANNSGALGGHASFPFLTLLWPFYWLVPKMETLFVLRGIFLTAGAIPLFALAKKRLGSFMALVFSAAYLLHPIIVGQSMWDIYEAHFGIVFLLAAFWALDSNRLKTFWVMLLLFLAVREDYALTAIMFTFYLWWRKRDWRWAVFPLPIALTWFFLATRVILPYAIGGDYVFTGLYDQWGTGIFDIMLGIVTHPVAVVKAILVSRNITFFYYILLPFGLILFFWRSPVFLMAIPVFFIITLCNDQRANSLYNYYGLPIIGIIAVSCVYGLDKWGEKLKEKIPKEKLYAAVGVTLLVLTAWSVWRVVIIPHYNAGKLTRPYYAGEEGAYENRNEALLEALEQVPSDAPLFMPRYLGVFAARRGVIVFDGRVGMLDQVDYLIIDELSRDTATRDRFQAAPVLQELLKSSEVKKIFEKDGVVVYKRIR